MPRRLPPWAPRAAAVVGFLVGLLLVPRLWCAREAGRWYDDDVELGEALGRGVARWIDRDVRAAHFSTGSARFDFEWQFGTHTMAAMGFAQLARRDPRYEWQLALDRCLERLSERELRRFDTDAWHADALATLSGGGGHAAVLGYYNLALSARRNLSPPPSRTVIARNDAMTRAAMTRLEAAPLIETYPGEIYPVDNAAVVASVALYARALGREPPALVARWSRMARERWIDPHTGLLYQRVGADGRPLDAPRGSGTALAVYFTWFFDPALSRDLYAAMVRELRGGVIGFGAMREYARTHAGTGDIDSGPLFLGYGVSPTGFALAGARVHRDQATFASLYATTYLFGAPVDDRGGRRHATGGPLGDAILLAMLTAERAP